MLLLANGDKQSFEIELIEGENNEGEKRLLVEIAKNTS